MQVGECETNLSGVRELKKRDRPVVHNLKSLMGIDNLQPSETSAFEAQPEDQAVPIPSIANLDSDLFSKVKAIIYSFCGVEANYTM